jgi:hypothetical protein
MEKSSEADYGGQLLGWRQTDFKNRKSGLEI